MFICYLFPILNAEFIYHRLQIGRVTVAPVNHLSTDVNTWLYIEIYYSFIWWIGIMVFLLGAYIHKKKSIFKKGAADSIGNIWLQVDTGDFLHYLKWEAFTSSYNYSMIAMIILVQSLYISGEKNGNLLIYGIFAVIYCHRIL
jgi:hypothetical protein